jgi:hypothetical protein
MYQILVLGATILALVNAEVLHLTESDFSSHVDGSTNVLAEFYAPWLISAFSWQHILIYVCYL